MIRRRQERRCYNNAAYFILASCYRHDAHIFILSTLPPQDLLAVIFIDMTFSGRDIVVTAAPVVTARRAAGRKLIISSSRPMLGRTMPPLVFSLMPYHANARFHDRPATEYHLSPLLQNVGHNTSIYGGFKIIDFTLASIALMLHN